MPFIAEWKRASAGSDGGFQSNGGTSTAQLPACPSQKGGSLRLSLPELRDAKGQTRSTERLNQSRKTMRSTLNERNNEQRVLEQREEMRKGGPASSEDRTSDSDFQQSPKVSKVAQMYSIFLFLFSAWNLILQTMPMD